LLILNSRDEIQQIEYTTIQTILQLPAVKKLFKENGFGPALDFAGRYIDARGDLTAAWNWNKDEDETPLLWPDTTYRFETLQMKRNAVIEWNTNPVVHGTDSKWWVIREKMNIEWPSDIHFELIFHAATPNLHKLLEWIDAVRMLDSCGDP
jgi:hypothetical protein